MSPLDVWVYRDNKQFAHGGSAVRALERSLAQVARLRTPTARRRAALEALIVAGELETALADVADPLERVVAEATDALATVAAGGTTDFSVCAEALLHARGPRSLAIRPHGGFAYDAVHPEAYAAASHVVDAANVAVIGLAGGGTTLAAMTAAAMRMRGRTAERTTLRRDGAGGSGELDAFFRRANAKNAAIIVVDEGAGPTGAPLLATGERAVCTGIPRERILFLVGRPPDASHAHGAERFRAFRSIVAPSAMFAPVRPNGTSETRDLSDGRWRHLHYDRPEDWPTTSHSNERRKLLSGGRLFKFEGLGTNGLGARHRASALAAEGIALDPTDEGAGWSSYAWEGRPLRARELDRDLLEHIARYCARRPSLCPLLSVESDLAPVVAKNVRTILGGASTPLESLEVVRMATPDGRLEPHEWIRLDDGSVRKTDATAHGDDRFFPGPTDIAWDLAGAIVEWAMDSATREYFLTLYRRASGDDASRRVTAWIVAYAAIRAALAIDAVRRAPVGEVPRLRADIERYRTRLAAEIAYAATS